MTPDLANALDPDQRLRAACVSEILDRYQGASIADVLSMADDLVAWIKGGTAPAPTEDRQGDTSGGAPAVAAHQAPSAREADHPPRPERQSASPPEHGVAVNAAGSLAASGEAGTIPPRARGDRSPIPDALIAHARARIEAGESYSSVARSVGSTPEALMARAKKGGWRVGRRKPKPAPAPKLTRKQCVEALYERGIKFKTGFDEDVPGGTTWIIDGRGPMGLAELQAFVGGL